MSTTETLTDTDARRMAPAGLEVDAELTENVAALMVSEQRPMVLNLLADLHPADVATLVQHLPFEHATDLFGWLPDEDAAYVLTELDGDFRGRLLGDIASSRVQTLLDALDTDDAADVLADVSDEVAAEVLPGLEDQADLEALLAFDEESAGGIMATEFVAVRDTTTLADVIEEVRRQAEEVEDLYVVYVIDDVGRLVGFVSLKRLVLGAGSSSVRGVMNSDVVSVPTRLDQEDVARVMERYDLVSLPVVDDEGRLVGRITIDDVVDVIRDEAEEDMQLMSGVSGYEEPTDSVLRITRGRLPWLVVGLVGAGLSGLVIGSFEEALQEAVVLATFIPIVMAMAGNAGIQSSSIVVQGLASGEVWNTDIFGRLGKELAVALINGLVLAVLLGGFTVLLAGTFGSTDAPVRLALTAGLSLLSVIIIAACIGTTVPLLLHRTRIDPALATGPFITTSNDILGLAVFFLLASLLYL